MFTSNMLKGNGNSPSLALLARVCGGFGRALLVSLPLVLGGPVAHAQLSLGGPPDDFVEDAVEETTQDQVEEAVQEQIEDQVEERALILGYETIDSKVEDQVEDNVQDVVEDQVDQAIDDNVEITLEANIEDDIEQDVEETIEGIVEESVEGNVEDRVEDAVSDSIAAGVEDSIEVAVEDSVSTEVEQSVEQSVEQNVEQVVEQSVEQNVEQSVEQNVEQVVEQSVEQTVEQSVENNVEDNVEYGVESAVEFQVAMVVEERVEDSVDEIIEKIEVNEDRIQKDQWLVMAAPEVFDELADEGYLFETVTELPGLGLRLAEVAAPSSFDITRVRQGVIDIVGSDRAEVDLNHIYTAGDQLAEQAGDGILPRAAVQFPPDTDQMQLRIGMIDSQVDTSHPALHDAHIQTRSFTHEGAAVPSFHGTAIASIIAGNGGGFQGIAPNAQVFAAGVFEEDPQRGEIASTVSLVRALDWLISSNVDVINISLAGPPNRLLEAALQRAAESHVTILAAAGNGGPVAGPMYPAAYKTVAAVTAVDAKNQVFRLANRGDYLDIAAPGVGVRHAKSGGGFAASSGTSFAVPFAATAVARLRHLQPGDNALELLCRTAEDLGPPGRDNIYGFGLLRPASS